MLADPSKLAEVRHRPISLRNTELIFSLKPQEVLGYSSALSLAMLELTAPSCDMVESASSRIGGERFGMAKGIIHW